MRPGPSAIHNVVHLLFRRLRMPLIVVICTYAVSIVVMTLIPGVDDQGRTWHMSFFHAFYFVSFMGSTIGFGEIPYPFTDAQRVWTTAAMYATVTAWLYAIGSLLALVQDPAFRRVVKDAAFARAVHRISQRYYIICGYGDTGSLLVGVLAANGIRSIVVDIDQSRIDALEIAGLPLEVPGLCADAADPSALLASGLLGTRCAGVVALTNDDQVNLTIAVTTRLLAPNVKVICRAEYEDTEANMASFGTDHIINPFVTFADSLAMAVDSPSMYLLYDWMTSTRKLPMEELVSPPRGTWVVCGYGRFGKAICKRVPIEGVSTVVIEANTEGTNAPATAVKGRGTEAVTLKEGRIEEAVAIIAGTDNGTNNLSIVITARDMNPDLFAVARQTEHRETPMFAGAQLDMIMQPWVIVANRAWALIRNPILAEFLRLARDQGNDWANIVISRITAVLEDEPPDTWMVSVTPGETPALYEAVDAAMDRGEQISLRELLRDPRNRADELSCVPLLLTRAGEEILMPDDDVALHKGDRLLFAGPAHVADTMRWSTQNANAFEYILTGSERPSGIVWRWLARETE